MLFYSYSTSVISKERYKHAVLFIFKMYVYFYALHMQSVYEYCLWTT